MPFVAAPLAAAVTTLVAMPAFAFKEVCEERFASNMRRQLGRRDKCKVSFGALENTTFSRRPVLPSYKQAVALPDPPAKSAMRQPKTEEQRTTTPPPSYERCVRFN